jgi:hypothetical protein
MDAQAKQTTGLMREMPEERYRAGEQAGQTLVRLESAVEGLQHSVEMPEKAYEYLEQAEARVEQLMEALYVLIGTNARIPGDWNNISNRGEKLVPNAE